MIPLRTRNANTANMGTLQNFRKPLQKKKGESFEMSLRVRVSKKVVRNLRGQASWETHAGAKDVDILRKR